jgi:hypothetical protein
MLNHPELRVVFFFRFHKKIPVIVLLSLLTGKGRLAEKCQALHRYIHTEYPVLGIDLRQ